MAGLMTKVLRDELETAVMEEVERIGPAGFRKDAIVKRFLDRGASKPTLYRWIDAKLASGEPGERVAEMVRDAVAARAARSADPATDAAAEVVEQLPAVVRVEDLSGGGGLEAVIEQLHQALAAAQQVMKYARTPEGAVRNAKLLLAASEHLRRTLDTSVRLHASIVDVMQVERFHKAIFDQLREEEPELAERVLVRLRRVSAEWGPNLRPDRVG